MGKDLPRKHKDSSEGESRKGFDSKQIMNKQLASIQQILTDNTSNGNQCKTSYFTEMTHAEKLLLSADIHKLSRRNLRRIVCYIQEREPLQENGNPDEFVIDLESMKPTTLRYLQSYMSALKKHKFIQKARKEKLQQEQEQEQQANKALVLSIRADHDYLAN